MNTDALIDRLAESATPVQRLKPAWIRAAGWLALGVPPLLAIAFIDGIRTYPRDFIGDGGRLIEVAAILATAATAAIAALAATVPERAGNGCFSPCCRLRSGLPISARPALPTGCASVPTASSCASMAPASRRW